MSKFLPSQLYKFGEKFFNQRLVLEFDIESPEFKEWCNHHDITDYELEFIKQGYEGRPLQAHGLEIIFPFGKFKGRKLVEVPEDYLKWCLEKEWIANWGNLDQQIKQVLSDKETEKVKTVEEIKSIIKLIE